MDLELAVLAGSWMEGARRARGPGTREERSHFMEPGGMGGLGVGKGFGPRCLPACHFWEGGGCVCLEFRGWIPLQVPQLVPPTPG